MARKIMTPRRLHEQLQVKDDNLVDLVADMPRTSRAAEESVLEPVDNHISLWVSQLDRDVKIHAKLHLVMQYPVEIAIKFIDVPPNNLEIKKHTMRTFFTTA
ncbi:hypothetical protein OUZ56_002621 [Daphnia magna]|uniref:Uncharacterized protein n=1 Tax=Daphnia magna TaxID=35525 RepID=A0ABR0A6P4_9CRUS|nr:hypothetical protein OUZ56_002621 [Daphnia magna]